MKNTLKFGLAGLIAASSSAFSAVPGDGWYAGLMGTLSHTPSMDFTISSTDFTTINSFLTSLGYAPLTSTAGSVNYSSIGGGGGGQLGYRYCGFRFEGELFYNYNSYDDITLGGYTLNTSPNSTLAYPFSNLSISGNTTLGAALFNVYYDFYDMDWDDVSWMPYIGLGIGYGYVRNKVNLEFNSTNSSGATVVTTLVDLSENTSTPVGQAILGVSYLFNDSFSMGLDYRYMTTRELSSFNERFTLHTLNLNFNYWFNNA
ncbi:outer membrane protein [Legionella brunensis]|uniref:Opacity protein-like surface antigen n=1 Tax=Legionella brunensis TaxID=29422 RepID=A0A0W0SDC6_9GAMM|nr:outer membrane beta-barrel protein [Legionella brunensis]KTC81475.1 opacity protein-like surface antigen [Legionella brunensis]